MQTIVAAIGFVYWYIIHTSNSCQQQLGSLLFEVCSDWRETAASFSPFLDFSRRFAPLSFLSPTSTNGVVQEISLTKLYPKIPNLQFLELGILQQPTATVCRILGVGCVWTRVILRSPNFNPRPK
jgi:hypothetical protein